MGAGKFGASFLSLKIGNYEVLFVTQCLAHEDPCYKLVCVFAQVKRDPLALWTRAQRTRVRGASVAPTRRAAPPPSSASVRRASPARSATKVRPRLSDVHGADVRVAIFLEWPVH